MADPRDPRTQPPASHWDRLFAEGDDLSWYEEVPETSVDLLCSGGVPRSVVDVGAGTSRLPDALLDAGVEHVTLLDLSMTALARTAVRLDERGNRVTTVVGDVLTHRFDETYDAWHDRAVFHFLVQPEQRAAYGAQLRRALAPGGLVVVGAFAPDGPDECSGLPVARYDAAGLATALGPGLRLEQSRRVDHHTPHDAVQPFTWVVLRRA